MLRRLLGETFSAARMWLSDPLWSASPPPRTKRARFSYLSFLVETLDEPGAVMSLADMQAWAWVLCGHYLRNAPAWDIEEARLDWGFMSEDERDRIKGVASRASRLAMRNIGESLPEEEELKERMRKCVREKAPEEFLKWATAPKRIDEWLQHAGLQESAYLVVRDLENELDVVRRSAARRSSEFRGVASIADIAADLEMTRWAKKEVLWLFMRSSRY